MLVRSRRAAAPVSNSASTTMRPLTMCRPPANLNIDATSALRQQVLVTGVLDSSAFTCAVIAMARSCHASQRPSARPWTSGPRHDPGVRRGQADRVVVRAAVVQGDVVEVQGGAGGRDRGPQVLDPVADAVAVGEHGVDPEVGRVLDQGGEMVGGTEAG